MGRNLLGYADKLWAPYYEFEYTGNIEEFTLPAGEYLLECNGAPGGKTTKYSEPLYGGTTYGVLNLSEPKTLYATVGGIGGDANNDNVTVGVGGWNGGADGGRSYRDEYPTGAGGGGASDIRTDVREIILINHEYDFDTDRIQPLNYVISDGQGVVMTDYIHNKNTKLELDCEILDPSEYPVSNAAYIFGSQLTATHGIYGLLYRADSENILTYELDYTYDTGGTPPFGQRVKFIVDGPKVEWFDTNGTKLGEIETQGSHESFIDQLVLFGKKSSVVSPYVIQYPGCIKFYSLTVTENDDTVAYYAPAKTKRYDITSELPSMTWEQGSIYDSGAPFSSNTRVRTVGYLDLPTSKIPRRLIVYAEDTNGNPLQFSAVQWDGDGNVVHPDQWYDSGHVHTLCGSCEKIRYILRRSTGTNIAPANVAFIRFEYPDDEVGLYNLFTNSFAQGVVKGEVPGTGVTHLEPGREVATTSVVLTRRLPIGFASRIIVAGGGGGQSWTGESANYGSPALGFGGGEYGGTPQLTGNDAFKYPTQSEGYLFGNGETPAKKTMSTEGGREGAGGGGGGWYGGYAASIPDNSLGSVNGGGGSSYVLTNTSHIPYPELYQPSSDFQLTNTIMLSGTSATPKVTIYKETSYIGKDDIITFPCVGRTEAIKLIPGIYEFTCYGGDGGLRYNHFTNPTYSRGGMAKGTFETFSKRDVFVTVGGSGNLSNFISTEWSSKHIPTISFNGGGQPGDSSKKSTAGGGGSDIRLDSNSLYARIIVAGGAGSQGDLTSYGGNGGGLEGVKASPVKYGTTPGPGTQTGSPTNSSYPTICGGFGYGGNGFYRSNGYGGAGGGGWYGGSGTYPNSSNDDETGGCGGSGYVYTHESYKPTGYLITDRADYLKHTTLTTGGNDLPRGNTMIKIKMLENKLKLLCSNEDLTTFYKFDELTSEWIDFKSTLPTDEEFDEYGIISITSDTGLPNQYKILTKSVDSSVDVNEFVLNVVPPEQTLETTMHDTMPIGKSIIDIDPYDESIYDIRMENSRRITDDDTIVTLCLKINKKENDDHKPKIFLTDVYSV